MFLARSWHRRVRTKDRVRNAPKRGSECLSHADWNLKWNGFHDGSLIEMARDRRQERIAQLLEEDRTRRGRVAPSGDHPIHVAAQADDIERVRRFLDDDPTLLERGDGAGGSPLHRGLKKMRELLTDAV
jgi:hypothetical protein